MMTQSESISKEQLVTHSVTITQFAILVTGLGMGGVIPSSYFNGLFALDLNIQLMTS